MDEDELYSIGDVARRTGLSVSAIRFYADSGVVPPAAVTDAGYRLYDVHAIARLELVRTLRELETSLPDIRKLLAGQTSLHDLASAHLRLIQAQAQQLAARRAVLRAIVSQHTTTEQVTLMHKLMSMSDDERDRLLDAFWDRVTDGLDVSPAVLERVRKIRPKLPADPGAEQVEAWIALAELVREAGFRREIREHLHNIYRTPHGRRMSSPGFHEALERRAAIIREAEEACRAGVPADSAPARDIADRYLAAGDPGVTAERMAEAFLAAKELLKDGPKFPGVFGRYVQLVATINGTLRTDAGAIPYQWLAAALTASRH